MIVTRLWALRFAGLALALVACTMEDGPVYDIPAREHAGWLNLEIDKDGSPLILSQISMYYTTNDKRGSYDELNRDINSQTVLYAKTGGTWKSHGFRNLGQQWGRVPKWTRNDQGALQPLVWNRDRITLYSGAAKEWQPEVRRALPDPGPFWREEEVPNVWPTGDGDWHRLDYDYRSNELLVRDANGNSARLDTGYNFRPVGQLHGPDWLGLVGLWQFWVDSTYKTHLIYLQWNRNLANPSPRKTVLGTFSPPSPVLVHRIQGEWRILASLEEGLAGWALKGDHFETMPTRINPWDSPSDRVESPNRYAANYGQFFIDSLDCLHKITVLISTPDTNQPQNFLKRSSLLHLNSCLTEPDTIDYSIRAGGKDEVVANEVFRIGPDGTLFHAFTVQVQKQYDHTVSVDWSNLPVSPSRIEFASKRPGGKWEYQTVASF